MGQRHITVAETSVFLRQAKAIWTEDEHDEFVLCIAGNPEAGDVIPETGGFARPPSVKQESLMSKFGRELIASMKQVARHARGTKARGMRITVVELPDVKAIRKELHMSQQKFAASYRIPLATVKNWEQGRRAPDAPAAAYLRAIRKRPKEVMEAVAG